MRPSLRPLALIAALTLLTACTSGPDKRDDAPPRPVAQGIVELMAHIPATHAGVVAIRPGNQNAIDQLYAKYVDVGPTHAGVSPFEEIVKSLVGAESAEGFPDMAQVDKGRPILASFGHTGEADDFKNVPFGAVMMPSEIPDHMWTRVLVPALDARALRDAMATWANNDGARSEMVGPDIVILGVGRAWGLSAKEGHVQLDALVGTGTEEARRESLKTAMATKGKPNRDTTPALLHFYENAGFASAWIPMGNLSSLNAVIGMIQARDALASAPRDYYGNLFAAGASLTVQSTLWTNPLDRNVTDVAMSFGAGDALDFRITRSFTEPAATAHKAAREQSGHVYAPRSEKPLFAAQIGLSLRALALARGGSPVWPDNKLPYRQMAEIFRQSGTVATFYTLLNVPSTMPGTTTTQEGETLVTFIPDSATVVVERFDLDRSGKPDIVAAIAMEYPSDAPVPRILAMLEALKKEMADAGVSLLVREESYKGRSRILLGMGKAPEAILDLETPIIAPDDIRVAMDPSQLSVLAPMVDPLLGAMMPKLGPIEAVDHSDAVSQVTRIRVAPPNAKALPRLEAIFVPSAVPPAVTSNTTELRCLLRASHAFTQASMAASSASTETRATLIAHGLDLISKDLTCARRSPEFRPVSDELESGWLGAMGLALSLSNYSEGLTMLRKSCTLGREASCALAAQLTPPYPEGSLILPEAAWPVTPSPMNVSHTLYVTSEGIYLGKKRIADTKRMVPGGEGPYPWLVDGFMGMDDILPNDTSGSALELQIHAPLGFNKVRRIIQSAKRFGFTAMSVTVRSGGQVRSANILVHDIDDLAEPTQTDAWASWPFLVPQDDADNAYVNVSKDALVVRFNRNTVLTMPIGSEGLTGDHTLALARGLQKIEVDSGAKTVAIHLIITADITWSRTADLIGVLQTPITNALHTAEEVTQFVKEHNGTWDNNLRPIVFESAEPLGTGGGYGQKLDPSRTPRISNDPVIGGPPIGKEVISRVIRNHSKAIRYCYEKALTKDPRLSGTVTVKFTIGAEGKVVNVKVSKTTMNNPDVEACVLRRIQLMVFPKPKGGGLTIITYPFSFKAAE